MERLHKQLKFSDEGLLQALRAAFPREFTAKALPDDAEVVGLCWDKANGLVEMVVSSERFNEEPRP